MSIAKFSVKNSVLVNLLMIGLFLFGGISLFDMPTELNPEVNFNWVFITVVYPGASPEETESLTPLFLLMIKTLDVSYWNTIL